VRAGRRVPTEGHPNDNHLSGDDNYEEADDNDQEVDDNDQEVDDNYNDNYNHADDDYNRQRQLQPRRRPAATPDTTDEVGGRTMTELVSAGHSARA
jgi:hypothetical protein